MPPIPPTTLVNYLFAVVALTLGLLVVIRNPKNLQNKLFTLFSLASTFWIFTSATVDLFISRLDWALVFADLAIVGGFFLLPTLFMFIHYFIRETYPLSRKRILLIYLPALLCLPLTFTRYNIESVSRESWGVNFVPGQLYLVLFLYWFVMLGLSTYEFIKKYKGFVAEEVKLLRPVFLGAVLMVFFGALANAILPLLGFGQAALFGPVASIFFILFTTYAIARHQLLDVKVIATELFVAILVFLNLAQLFSADSISQLILRLLFLAVTVSFGALLIRSVRNEVRRREEVQRLAAQLEASNKRLRQLDDLKTTMVSIASHQIRGPLGGIRGYLSMFRDGDLGPINEKQKEIVTLNMNVTTRLLNAVETFLDITKLESGALTLRKETLPLDDAVKDVVEEFLLPASKKGLAISMAFDCDCPIWVEFDPDKIKHVIFNLIDNALKYTERGSILARVRCDGKEAVFEVTDTGMGILPEDAPKLFSKYQRGELVIDRGGSGLGLYVVKMLTEMQGGRVWASSPGVGKGSTFGFALPLAKRL